MIAFLDLCVCQVARIWGKPVVFLTLAFFFFVVKTNARARALSESLLLNRGNMCFLETTVPLPKKEVAQPNLLITSIDNAYDVGEISYTDSIFLTINQVMIFA